MSQLINYYIYGLVDPRDNTIKYVGKGQKNRMFQHVNLVKSNNCNDKNFTKYESLKEILQDYEDISYCKLFETTNENEAYIKETELITKHNTLIPNGWNILLHAKPPEMTDERKIKIRNSSIGKKMSEEAKIKMSLSKKGKSPWNIGLTLSDEHCSKLSNSHKNRSADIQNKITKSKRQHEFFDIYKTKYNTYKVEIRENKQRFCKFAKTLEEAIIIRNDYLGLD